VASIAREEKHTIGLVSDVMSDAILVCRDKTPITSAARTMTEARWRSVLVVNEAGKPEGVVSGKDLMRFVEKGVDIKLTVHDVMHKALTINFNASLREAADIMIQTHHHRLVVLDDKNPDAFPLGIISSFDIVGAMARQGSIWQS
jgi:CBS domain-containing protein